MRIRGRWVVIQLECSANLSTCRRTHCRCSARRKPCLSVDGRHHPAHRAGEIRPSDRSSWVDLYKEIRSTTTMSHSEVPCLLRGRLRMSERGSLELWTRSSTRMASSAVVTVAYCMTSVGSGRGLGILLERVITSSRSIAPIETDQ